MMKRAFGLVSVLSLLTNPAWGGFSGIPSGPVQDMTPVPQKRSLFYKEAPPACKVPSVQVMSTFSIEALHSIYKNALCSNVTEEITVERIDVDYCQAIAGCDNSKNITSEDQQFIQREAKDFLIREVTNSELAKYSATDKQPFVNLMGEIDKLPNKYRDQVITCELAQTTASASCSLEDSEKTRLVQNYVANAFYKDTKASSNNVSLTNNQKEISAEAKLLAAKAQAVVNGNQGFPTLLSEIKNAESQNSSVTYDSSESMAEFMLAGLTAKAKNSNIGLLSADEKKQIVKKFLIKAMDDSNSHIFKYVNKYRTDIILQAVNTMDFNKIDFLSNDAVNIVAGKINEVKVMLANSHMKNDCAKYNVSIGQVCTNIAKKIEKGSAHAILKEHKEDPFKSMIAFYRGSDFSLKNKAIRHLQNFLNDPDNIYHAHLIYALQMNICGEKFPNELRTTLPVKTSSEMEDKLQDYKASTERSRADTIATFAETVKRSPSFQKEINSLGVSFNESPSTKKESAALDLIASAKQDNATVQKTESFTSSSKDFFPEQAAVQNKMQNRDQDFVSNEGMNRFIPVEERRTNVLDEKDAALNSKLEELKNKEKALSKKLAQTNDTEKSGDQDMLGDLRRQIEELKKNQSKLASARNQTQADAPVASERNTQASKSGSYKSAVISAATNNGEEETVANNSSPSAVASNASATGSEQSFNNGATRGPASVATGGSSGFSSKESREKAVSGITLTKTGDVIQDPASIIDNPQEGDIANMLEVTNGQPFLIRENGVLMKVLVELDSKGKPQISNGKIRFKKERLTKAQQQFVTQDLNVQKSLKEVDRDPTRLLNLKNLLKTTFKRN